MVIIGLSACSIFICGILLGILLTKHGMGYREASTGKEPGAMRDLWEMLCAMAFILGWSIVIFSIAVGILGLGVVSFRVLRSIIGF